ncbi:hypothetical protein CFK39_00470 [Brachybacterium avium]|uniref:DUF4352 domain-containing protein n=1 Tax=Brachybacterium avium TaxID=2017485 RepID=A0A220U8Z8_9MICO|nr:hypothetical protein [Brachybacterium avium]ASK64570.1 hypothetical protein CFK39_00470 [Brachybacterium avium]
MAYRFNPPPNWPIEDASWSPPPGWQPDPAWGPAPEGWNFWIAQEQPPAAPPQPEGQAPADAQAQADAEDDATRVVSTGEQGMDEPRATEQPATAQDGTVQESTPAAEPVAQYGAMNPYGAAPSQAEAAAAEDVHGRHAVGPEDDATHVADSSQRTAAAEAPDQQAAPLAPAADAPQGSTDDADAQSGGASQTAEYQGPDLEADLAQQTPYESTGPVSDQGHDAHTPQDGQPDEASGAGYGTAAAAGGIAAGGAAAGAAAAGYGQASPAPGYGQGSPAPGYGQGSAPDYPGQGSASDYPAQGYGQGSPVPGYGQGSPGVDDGAAWTASTGAGEPPRKSFLKRFWWLGCLFILLLVLILLIGGGIWLFSRDSGNEAGGGGGATTSQEETTDGNESASEEPSEDPSEEATTEEEEEDATPEAVTPTDLVTIDPSAEPVDFVGTDGTGTMAVHMTYAKAEDLESSWGGTVEESEYGGYLVVTAKLTVTEGEVSLNPFQFSVKTPYGGAVDPSSESYSLVGSGIGGNAPSEFEAGDEYTVQMLFEVARAGGNTLNFNTYTDNYTWDVPE